ncbi:MAG: hypothetical protein HY074_09860 [Deltaproteobacteria bacterium]|nr:hypothetical protein [Deltaproteobacteria bacterium]
MLKGLTWSFLIHALLLPQAGAASSSKHLDELRKRYPYGLIGDDFGLLNVDDLAVNTCDAEPEPFSEKSIAYPYWQCFETNKIVFSCKLEDYDESIKKQLAGIEITVSLSDQQISYSSRRAIVLSNCKWFESEWKRVTQNQKHVCLSGPRGSDDEMSGVQKQTNRMFDKFKTQHGCVSYFHGDCDLQYRLAQDCVAQPK